MQDHLRTARKRDAPCELREQGAYPVVEAILEEARPGERHGGGGAKPAIVKYAIHASGCPGH